MNLRATEALAYSLKTTSLKAVALVICEEPSQRQIHPNCISSQSHPSLVAHQTLGGGVNLWEVSVSGHNGSGIRGASVIRGGRSSTRRYRQSLEGSQSAMGWVHVHVDDVPEPRRRAVADSFLTSLEAAPAPAAIAGDIFSIFFFKKAQKERE